jgi:Inner membrane component of T3SS, cytoplasmic domain
MNVLVEGFDRRGHRLFRERLALPPGKRAFTIGRSAAADVTIDDEHVAPLHVSLEVTDQGQVLATDLGSVNGIVVSDNRQYAARNLELVENTLQIGVTLVRIRTPFEKDAPEKPLRQHLCLLPFRPHWIAAICAVMFFVQMAYETWLDAPHRLLDSVAISISLGALATGLWASLWALLTRIMLGHWRWIVHAAIAVAVSLSFGIINEALELGWFAFSLPAWPHQLSWLLGLGLASALYLHLIHSSNLTARRAGIVACLLPALVVGITTWLLDRSSLRDVNHVSTAQRIFPPSLRLRPANSLDDYVKSAAALRHSADARRNISLVDDPDGTAQE